MRWSWFLIVVGLSAGLGTQAFGQVRGRDVLIVEPDAPVVVQETFEINQATFDQWIYGNRLRNGTALDYLESVLAVKFAEVDRACTLAEPQKQRLMLAGHGDIKRFHDRVAEVHADFERYKRDQARMNELFQQTIPLATALNAGLFGDGSIFAKAIGTTLTPEQAEQYRVALRSKARYRHKARVLLALANLDAAVGFSSDQQERFAAAILAATTPIEKPAGPYETNIILLKIAQVPESQVRSIFNDDQWKLLQDQFVQARAMEPFLKANGHIPREGKGAALVMPPHPENALPNLPGNIRFDVVIPR